MMQRMQKGPFRIRKAKLEDCQEIAEVQIESYRRAYAGLFPQAYLERFTPGEQEQDWIELLRARPDEILLVAETASGTLVGYVLARAEKDIYPGFDAEIVAMHVRKMAQRKGAGRALFQEALLELVGRRCRSVMLWTLKGNPTRQWYERLGGAVLGEKHYQVEDWEIVEVAYGWESLADLGRRFSPDKPTDQAGTPPKNSAP